MNEAVPKADCVSVATSCTEVTSSLIKLHPKSGDYLVGQLEPSGPERKDAPYSKYICLCSKRVLADSVVIQHKTSACPKRYLRKLPWIMTEMSDRLPPGTGGTTRLVSGRKPPYRSALETAAQTRRRKPPSLLGHPCTLPASPFEGT